MSRLPNTRPALPSSESSDSSENAEGRLPVTAIGANGASGTWSDPGQPDLGENSIRNGRLSAAERQRRYRARRQRGATLIRLDVLPRHVSALDALGLIPAGDGELSKEELSAAVLRFLDAAEPLSLVAEALNVEPAD